MESSFFIEENWLRRITMKLSKLFHYSVIA